MKSRFYPVFILLCALFPLMSFAQQDSFSVYFPTGGGKVSDSIQDRIDALFLAEKIQGAHSIAIYGYADEPGTAGQNRRLSAMRATAVRDYLLQWGIKPAQINACEGRGYTSGAGASAADRRADILINRVLPAVAPPVVTDHDAGTASSGLANLDKLEEGQAMEIDNLLFVQGTSAIIPSSNTVLKQLADILAANPQLHVRLEGHICCMTSKNYREAGFNNLSEQRAMAVYDYLVYHGIAAARLSYRGMGNSHPKCYPERTEEDRQANRRVEVRVLSK
ncbi:OmpA family protein [Chitinophagaceae bacterium MMS25-I14]